MSHDVFDPANYTSAQIREFKAENAERVREASKRGDVSIDGMPLKVTLELTADCDLFCRMCEFPAPREAGRKNGYALVMKEEDFEALIVPQVMPYALLVNLTVVGEPLLVPYLDRVLDIAGQWGTRVEFITHGQHMDRAMIDKIGWTAAGVVFSFDGGTRDTFNRIRIGGDFNVITTNILRFQRWRERHIGEGEYQPYLHVNMTLMQENIQELPTVVRLCSMLGVDKLSGALMVAFNPKMAKSSLLNHQALANKAIRRAREVAEEVGMHIVIPVEFPGVTEDEIEAVELVEPDLPDGPVPHLADALAGGEIPDLTPEPSPPEESFHEIGANIPEPDADGNVVFVPLDEVGGTAQVDAAAKTHEIVPGQGALNKERAFGSPLQQTPTEKKLQGQIAVADSVDGLDQRVLEVGMGKDESGGTGGTCKFLWNELFVGLQGDVAPCCVQGRPIVGNIFEQDLASIWNGPMMQEMRQRLLIGDPVDCCRDCNYNTERGRGDYREDTLIIPDRAQRARDF